MYVLKMLMLIVEVLCSLLLVVVILLQKSKSQGLGMAFGAGMGESLFGSRAGNVLSKITIILGIVFLVNTLFLGILFAHAQDARQQQGRGLMSKPAQVPLATPLRAQTGLPPTRIDLPVTPPVSVPVNPAPAVPAPAPAVPVPAPAPAPAK
ncbi:MAG: preprotein translocase subunit SecG [Kiritimatiellaeota bacterium]|nr:preprotein translocase subunit SecG [Kiritimatiellota bacterium]